MCVSCQVGIYAVSGILFAVANYKIRPVSATLLCVNMNIYFPCHLAPGQNDIENCGGYVCFCSGTIINAIREYECFGAIFVYTHDDEMIASMLLSADAHLML